MRLSRSARQPADRPASERPGDPDETVDDLSAIGDPAGSASADPADGIDLSSLSVAGITRRRVGWLSAALVSAWIVVIFARQAGDTATASARVDQMNEDNRALAAEVASLERELVTIEKPTYISLEARGYRIGTDREVPFTLDASVPVPGADAPGSSALRLGSREHSRTPLESWLSILFGPSN